MNKKSLKLNPEYDKAPYHIWFPCLQSHPITGIKPFNKIEIGPPPKPFNIIPHER